KGERVANQQAEPIMQGAVIQPPAIEDRPDERRQKRDDQISEGGNILERRVATTRGEKSSRTSGEVENVGRAPGNDRMAEVDIRREEEVSPGRCGEDTDAASFRQRIEEPIAGEKSKSDAQSNRPPRHDFRGRLRILQDGLDCSVRHVEVFYRGCRGRS